MYLWNTKQLARDLKEGNIPESDKYKYIIALMIMVGPPLVYELQITSAPVGSMSLIFWVLLLVIIFWGVQKCFQANANGDNKNFIERFICLSVPVGIKLSLISIIANYLAFSLNSNLFLENTTFASIAEIKGKLQATSYLSSLIVSLLITVVFFYIVNRYLHFISGGQKTSNNSVE